MAKIMTIEDLALITKKGFEDVMERFDAHDKRFDAHDKRFDAHDKRFDAIESRLSHIEARLDMIEQDLSDLRKLRQEIRIIHELLDEVVTIKHIKKLEARLFRVEKHLGLA